MVLRVVINVQWTPVHPTLEKRAEEAGNLLNYFCSLFVGSECTKKKVMCQAKNWREK